MAKAKAKIETAAERYRRLKAENLEAAISSPVAEGVELFDLTTPSGMTWKLRRPDIPALVEAGALPMSFAAKMIEATSKSAGTSNLDEVMSPEDQARAIRFTSVIVRYCAVEPQIVETPDDSGNQIGFDEVTTGDYTAISEWAMGGGKEAASLATFRG